MKILPTTPLSWIIWSLKERHSKIVRVTEKRLAPIHHADAAVVIAIRQMNEAGISDATIIGIDEWCGYRPAHISMYRVIKSGLLIKDGKKVGHRCVFRLTPAGFSESKRTEEAIAALIEKCHANELVRKTTA
jgi:hypothetical protein